ncbi:MAG: hypothetical protein HZA28_06120 [Candidatus Omnitrophica bacterium]|nr:hypothetical protein [Candidatus Omnitrophota bacterium]
MDRKQVGRVVLVAASVCVWVYLVFCYPTIRLFTLLLPPVIALHWSKTIRWRNVFISIFTLLWLFVFHYESTRYFYLTPFAQREMLKFKFLFPPAGWIMFFNVDDSYSYVEVYGKKGEALQPIDPHDILRTRTIGFDNIHRNVLSTVYSRELAGPFCRFLKRRLPYYDDFVVVAVEYPSVSREPDRRLQQALYRCGP